MLRRKKQLNYKRMLFIGDSITEWGRFDDEENIGNNYVRMIRDDLAINHSNSFPEIINRGVGGNRIPDLVNRWQVDVLDHNPDLISISIGVNDVWRQVDGSGVEPILPEEYEKLFVQLIEETQATLEAEIILMEPTIIGEDADSEGNKKLVAYVEIVNKLAEQYRLMVVPTHQAFLDYLERKGPLALTFDGVHMSSTGNALMAKTWLETVIK